ncbi:uncharacterized protein LOC144445398 [Glandiceps talaboti]
MADSSSSDFESRQNSSDSDDSTFDDGFGMFDGPIEPYMYEPCDSSANESVSDPDENDADDRVGNINWCSCTQCQEMLKQVDSICCCEIDDVKKKMDELDAETNCITDHPGFIPVCLNEWVLQTAYFQYRQQYGSRQEENTSERYR